MPIKYSFSVYGAAVQIRCSCAVMEEQIKFFLSPFLLSRPASQGYEFHGEVRPFELREVTHSLSRAGASDRHCDDLVEVYSLGEKHWIVDDRWGLCEIDLLKRSWRSWVLPSPSLDAVQLTEAAALTPMAYLLRSRGVEMVPAISIERSGWGGLVISPYPIPGELKRIMKAGYRIIGQRWTALTSQNGRLVLRHVPGLVEPRESLGRSIGRRPVWTNLTEEHPWSTADMAWCDAVVAIVPGRRLKTNGRVLSSTDSQLVLRRAWPMRDLDINRPRLSHPAALLGRDCLCLSVQLSRREDEFLDLIEFSRQRSASRVKVSINEALRKHHVPARLAG